ncbi:MAG: response regulator [Desulfobacter sp.]|nr:MAG: response regulator [Desulfobacter sp.]
MTILSFFSGTFCGKETIIQEISQAHGLRTITDLDLISTASELSNISEKKISRAFLDKPSVFNKFTHEKERSIAYLRLALAKNLAEPDFLLDGFTSMLIPSAVSHVLKICLIADTASRATRAAADKQISEKEAVGHVRRDDEIAGAWCDSLFKVQDPWDPSLYDIVIPTDKMDVQAAAALVADNLKREVIQPTKASLKAATDFVLAANVEVALAKEGHAVGVSARDGLVTLTIHNNVLLLGRLEEELKAIAGQVAGVDTVETRIGKGFYQTDIYRKFDFQVPSKVLLVDDEREFVQTLSERLQMRDVGSAIAYDGESALNLVAEDAPDVMILDLKMPGIDGIEVLKQVKEKTPDVEVIILTGHGSEADRDICMNLGAFAYLHKPVDIEELSRVLEDANKKHRQGEGA